MEIIKGDNPEMEINNSVRLAIDRIPEYRNSSSVVNFNGIPFPSFGVHIGLFDAQMFDDFDSRLDGKHFNELLKEFVRTLESTFDCFKTGAIEIRMERRTILIGESLNDVVRVEFGVFERGYGEYHGDECKFIYKVHINN